MTDYGSMSHQQLYTFVQSGSVADVENAATLNANHATSVTQATTDLNNTLQKIQASWTGAAADQFTQQANALVQQMTKHAETADNTHTWMKYASDSLNWAQGQMPPPPSQAEQDLAAINSNPVEEWGLAIATGGASYVASKAASDDMAAKKAVATSVMTQLASAYSTSNSHLSAGRYDSTTDTNGSTSGNNNGKGDQSGNGGSSSGSGNGSSGVGMVMPMPMAMPMSSGGGGSEGASARISTPSYGTGSSSSGSGTGFSSSGVTDSHLPSSTVTSGTGDLPASGVTSPTTTGVTNTGLGPTGGSNYKSSYPNFGTGGVNEYPGGTGSMPTEGEPGLGGSGGRLGSGKLSGLGGGGLGEGGAGGYGSTGLGSGSGSGRTSALSGGTGTGELGEEAGGTGYGAQTTEGSGTAAGTSAAAAAGEAEGANSTQNNMQGGMGGMGRGGAGGGSQGERGNRASWLREDPDYWYGDKMKNAAPPGGVIE